MAYLQQITSKSQSYPQTHEGEDVGTDMGVQSPLIENFLVGPLQMRCSVVTDIQTGDTVIIDGGDEPQRLIDWIEKPDPTGTYINAFYRPLLFSDIDDDNLDIVRDRTFDTVGAINYGGGKFPVYQ